VSHDLPRLHPGGNPGEPHLAERDLAGYLDGAMDPAGRRRIEAHLVRCDACLDELVSALLQLRRRVPPRPGD